MNTLKSVEDYKNLGFIELCRGADSDGDTAYLYMSVPADRHADYKRACTSHEPFDPRDYGTIIAQGKGTPPASLISELKNKYQFWDGFEDAMHALGQKILKEKKQS